MTPGVVAESDLAGTLKSEYVFFDGERVARRDAASNGGTGGVFYYFSDELKTASVITDSAGTIKAESDYYPWGGELQLVNNDSNDYKFTGKKRDAETGLDYFGARYYSNGLGRWVSADWSVKPVPIPYAALTDPQTLNLYNYVGGLPTTRVDADGHTDDKRLATYMKRFHVSDCSVQVKRCASMKKQMQADLKAARAAYDRAITLKIAEQERFAEEIQTIGPTIGMMIIADPFGVEGAIGSEITEAREVEELAEVGELTNALKTFDEARTEAFDLAGMTKAEEVKFTRVDPETGTVVEFKGPDGAKVRYDGPHPETPGPAHDQPHVSFQSGGKTSQGGRQRGNIPYRRPQHPASGGRGVGDVEPH